MIRIKRGITAAALCVLLIVLCQTAWAANHGYGYWQLTEKQKYLYDLMAEQTADCAAEIPVEESRGVTQDDAQMAMVLFLSDYPEYSWLGKKDGERVYYFDIYKKGGIVVSMKPCYNSTASACRPALQNAAQTALSTISTGQSQYDKALALHDYLAQQVSYAYGSMENLTAYGALVKGSAACTGYAKAYQYLLQKAGIVAWTVMGTATNSAGTQEHAWNVAYLDGAWYYIDVTWDDTNIGITHDYFGLSLSQISADHSLASPYSYMQPGSGTVIPTFYEGTVAPPVQQLPPEEPPAEPPAEETAPSTEPAVEEAVPPPEVPEQTASEEPAELSEPEKPNPPAADAAVDQPEPVPETEPGTALLWGGIAGGVILAGGLFAGIRYRKKRKGGRRMA